jgi:hypothetical protein
MNRIGGQVFILLLVGVAIAVDRAVRLLPPCDECLGGVE